LENKLKGVLVLRWKSDRTLIFGKVRSGSVGDSTYGTSILAKVPIFWGIHHIFTKDAWKI